MTLGVPGADLWQQVAAGQHGPSYASAYAAHFDRLAAGGRDLDGEGRFVASRVPAGGRILDAGCGTGRLTAYLADQGYDVVGVDADAPMVAEARRRRSDLTFEVGALESLDLVGSFDAVVAAGNVVAFVGTGWAAAAAALAGLVVPGGLLVTGFGLDVDHLPVGVPVLDLGGYDDACAGAGWSLESRWATWDADPWTDGGYAVSVHRRD